MPNDAAQIAELSNLTTETEQIDDLLSDENEANDVEENDSEIEENELEMQLEALINNVVGVERGWFVDQ